VGLLLITAPKRAEKMAHDNTKQADATQHNAGDHGAADARNTLTNLALTLFQCKDGSLVSRPTECRKTTNELPGFTITGQG
jgi:hypothetical protein